MKQYTILATALLLGFTHGRFSKYFDRRLQDTVENCCATCLRQDSIKGFDALDFDTCTEGKGGCCFEPTCRQSEMGSMTFSSDLEFENGDPVIEQGKWIQLQWSTADRVTYIVVNEGQTKNTQPQNTSSAALFENGWYQMCAQNPGEVYFRAWKDSGCSASKEFSVRVKPGSGDALCSASPSKPAAASGECNLNRASIINGECVCASDWAGAPECNDLPTWKWLVTIGGGLAALVSIAVSIHAFMQRRKRQNRDTLSYSPGGGKLGSDVLRVSPNTQDGEAYHPVKDVQPAPAPKECTL